MKESFEHNLREAAALYREHGLDLNKYDRENLKKLLTMIEAAAGDQKTSDDTQHEVLFILQRQKQEVMNQLHEHLKLCDSDEPLRVTDESRALSIIEQGKLLFEMGDGQMNEVSEGVLMTDMAWGHCYELPAATPRALKKRYAVAYAKSQLRSLLDQQIIANETNSSEVHWMKQAAYNTIKDGEESGEREQQSGVIAEKIAEGLLTQMSIDGALPYEVEWADVYEDVEHKADFIIHKKKHGRAVTVEDTGSLPDDPADFAVQFTTDDSEEKQEYKKNQLARLKEVDGVFDTVLVTYSNMRVKAAVREWEQNGRPPGGPTAFLERHTKRKLFNELLKHMFSENERTEMWSKASKGL